MEDIKEAGYHPADSNGDGKVDNEERKMYLEFKRKELEDQDAMRDAQRKMTWFALAGMLLYPATVMTTEVMGLHQAAEILGSMASVGSWYCSCILWGSSMVWQKVVPLLFLTSCVAMSPNLEIHEDLVTGQEYYSFELGVSYPKKKFMTADEWQEYHESPDSQKEALYATYKEREEIEKRWENFIENCLLAATLDC